MLYGCTCISLAIFVLLTSWIWLPFLLVTSPVWLSFTLIAYGLLKGLGFWSQFLRLFIDAYIWLLFRSDKPRKYLWKKFYNFLCRMYPQSGWKIINYGYAINTETGHTIVLDEDEETERYPYQLYHYIATGLKKFPNLAGLTVLDIGCGRGGGLAYVAKYLKPANAIGIDYSRDQIDFCNKNYNLPNTTFVCSDAEKLLLKNELADIVISIESCHCFGNLRAFVSEVERVLKPGGQFFVADYLAIGDVPEFEECLNSAGLEQQEKQDITENILISLKFDSNRRVDWIENYTPFYFHRMLKRFSGIEGSNVYNQMEAGDWVYLAYHFIKRKN
ncbi:unnamed protein product [Blepharisma stoltei]|uniref:Methyltransferase type 11 domain-containing protein n=1 Tax=Blepharisma stoltei TaxID=1481888 RepID=A0AAU9JD54_9CILI|nr:unnamed protein product [Blepharisma stoltei]